MEFDEAVNQYEFMIYKYMTDYHIFGYSVDDMVNLGRFVLWRCCQGYDSSKGASFTTYFINSMRKECWALNRYNNLEKRVKDKECIGIHLPCAEDSTITYLDVIEDIRKYDESLDYKIKEMIDLLERVDLRDRPIIKTYVLNKIYVNDKYTQMDLCRDYNCSITKVRRIIKDFQYLVKKEWGLL